MTDESRLNILTRTLSTNLHHNNTSEWPLSLENKFFRVSVKWLRVKKKKERFF